MIIFGVRPKNLHANLPTRSSRCYHDGELILIHVHMALVEATKDALRHERKGMPDSA